MLRPEDGSVSFGIGLTCDGCSACAQQCPVAAISGHFKERYAIDAALCIDCGVCGLVCPKQAVFDGNGQLAVRIPRDQRPRPVIDENLCNGCHLCADFCPFGCLRMLGPRYQGHAALAIPHRCVSCGDCARVCIKGAITLAPPRNDRAIIQTCADRERPGPAAPP